MKTDIPTEMNDKVVDLLSSTLRRGMEIGLRAMAKKCHVEAKLLYETIRAMDRGFNYVCQCTSWKDGRCERCGCKDPLGTRQPGDDSPYEMMKSCIRQKPTSG